MGSALLVLVMCFVVVTPVMAAQEIPSVPSNTSKIGIFQQSLSERYLGLLGYSSLTAVRSDFKLELSGIQSTTTYNATNDCGISVKVTIESTLSIHQTNNASGYTYNAQFSSSDGKKYSIREILFTINRLKYSNNCFRCANNWVNALFFILD